MSRAEILKTLKDFKKKHSKEYGILDIGVFGSVARGENNENSNVDIVVKMMRQDLFNMIGIKQDLEEILNTPVDVISYRDKMNLLLKKRIDKDAVYV